jgi:hypothetical protein
LLIESELDARYDPTRFGQQIVGCGCVKVSSATRCRVENMFHTVVDLFEDREYLKIWQFY